MRALLRLLSVAQIRPRLVLFVALVAVSISVGLAGRLGMEGSYLPLMSRHDPAVVEYRASVKRFGQLNGLTVLVEGDERSAVMELVSDLLGRVLADETMDLRALWPLDVSSGAFAVSSSDGLAGLFDGPVVRGVTATEALGDILVRGWDRSVASGGTNRLAALLATAGNPGEGRRWALAVTPRGDGLDVAVLKGLHARVTGWCDGLLRARRDASLRLGLTGIAALAHDEEKLLLGEVTRLGGAALLVVALLFLAGLRSLRLCVVVFLPLLGGVLLGLGAYALRGRDLNMVTSVFPVMIFGLGIDYALHLVVEARRQRALGRTRASAVRRAFLLCAPAVVASAATTAGAFFALAAAEFGGIVELGWLSGLAIVAIALMSLTAVPALLLLFGEGDRPVENPPPRGEGRTGGFASGSSIAVGVAFLILVLVGLPRLRWDDSLLAVQPGNLPARIVQDRLGRTGLAEALLLRLPASVPAAVLDDLETRFGLTVLRPDRAAYLAQRMGELLSALERSIGELLRLAPASTAAAGSIAAALKRLEDVCLEAGDLLYASGAAFDEVALDEAVRRIERWRGAPLDFDGRLRGWLEELRRLVEGLGGKAGPLAILRELGRREAHGVTILALGDRRLWRAEPCRALLGRLREAGGTATGPVLIFQRLAATVRSDAVRTAWIAALVVVCFLFAAHRSPGRVIAALVPLSAGYLAMGGVLGWAGIPVSMGNLPAFPLLFGVGVDYGIHMVERCRSRGSRVRIRGREGLERALFLAAATTLSGFGALAFSRHPGLAGFGLALAAGVLASALGARILVPALARLGVFR